MPNKRFNPTYAASGFGWLLSRRSRDIRGLTLALGSNVPPDFGLTIMTTVDDPAELAGNPNGKALLAKYSRISISRIQYLANADPSILTTVKRGILFVMAFWSAPSIKAFGLLTDVIDRVDRDSILEVVVIDTDGASEFQQLPEFSGKMHGAGETAWIADGMIRTTSGMGYNPDSFLPNTIELLAVK